MILILCFALFEGVHLLRHLHFQAFLRFGEWNVSSKAIECSHGTPEQFCCKILLGKIAKILPLTFRTKVFLLWSQDLQQVLTEFVELSPSDNMKPFLQIQKLHES